MAEIKWIKLNIDMFDNRKIKQIRRLPGGNDIVLFWVMLLTLAGKCNSQGYILFTENIPYTPEMLANECDVELNTVKMALSVFSSYNMIAIQEEVIAITGWSEHQNVDGMERAKQLSNARVKKFRENKKKLIQAAKEETCSTEGNGISNVDVTLHETLRNAKETHIEQEQEEELEIDKEITTTSSCYSEVNVIDHFQKCNFLLSPLMVEMINADVEIYGAKWVCDAASESDLRGKHNYKYYKAILNNWKANGRDNKKKTGTENVSNNPAHKPFDFD